MARIPFTPEQKEANRIARNEKRKPERPNRIANETSEERDNRLAKSRLQSASYLASLTPQQRSARYAQQNALRSIRVKEKKPKKEPKRLGKRRVYRLGPESGSEYSASEEEEDGDSQAPGQGVPARRRNTLHLAAVLNGEGKLRFGLPEEDYLGPLDRACTNCRALHFKDEEKRNCRRQGESRIYSDCCSFGNMDPRYFDLPTYPPELMALFSDRHFMNNISRYNSAVAMGSTSYNYVRPPPGRGPSVFKVQGIISHCVYNLNNGVSNPNTNLGKCPDNRRLCVD